MTVTLAQGINNWEEMPCFYVIDGIQLTRADSLTQQKDTSSSEPCICWKDLFLGDCGLVWGAEKERNRKKGASVNFEVRQNWAQNLSLASIHFLSELPGLSKLQLSYMQKWCNSFYL